MDPSKPAAAVAQFLEAVRTGNDARATEMLSTVARQKTAAAKLRVTPQASDTARFEIGAVEFQDEDRAFVACVWTDLDGNGQPRAETAQWGVRREGEVWRVAGVAYTVFEGEDPLLLNFEDPDDMERQKQWLEAELARRAQPQGGSRQAMTPNNSRETNLR